MPPPGSANPRREKPWGADRPYLDYRFSHGFPRSHAMFWILAQGDTAPKDGGSMITMLLPFLLLFVVMYFLFIRPQRKAEAQKKEMLSAIKKNDRVVTNGGMIGVVTNVKDEELTIRVDENKDVKIRIHRNFIHAVLKKDDDEE
jgi:preprotein translocase subunit YajC